MRRLLLTFFFVLAFAFPTNAVVNSVCEFTQGSTTTNQGFINCDEELRQRAPAIASIANLRAATTATLPDNVANLLSWHSGLDIGGGLFWRDGTTGGADNSGTRILDASNRAWVRLAWDGVIAVPMFGAKGDGIANDAAAINLTLDHLRTATTAEAGWETVKQTLLFPPGRYLVSSPLNFQSLRSYGTFVQAHGAVIIGAVGAGNTVIDALDTRYLEWDGGTIIGPSTSSPGVGMVIGRRASDNRVADNISIRNLNIVGYFSKSNFVNLQAETVDLHNCTFASFHTGFASTTLALDSLNETGVTSTFTAQPSATPISANMFHAKDCEFKTFDSDGVTRGAGYPVRIITDYTDGAAWRDVTFDNYYANAIASPSAVQHTDYNVAIFFVKGYVHNLIIKGRGERFGYIDSILRIANDTAIARIKGLTMREHYLGVKSGMIQSNGGANAIIITQGDLSATRSQEMLQGSPLAAPAGTLFGKANSGADSLITFNGTVEVPNDSADAYRLNNFSGVAVFNGAIYTQAPHPDIVYPPAGQYVGFNNTKVQHGGSHTFDSINGLFTVTGAMGLGIYTRATLPVPSSIGTGAALVSNPEAGKGRMVVSTGTLWQYAGDGTTVTGAPTG